MSYLLKSLENEYLKEDVPEIRIGDIVKVHNRIVEGRNERVQVFQGTVIAIKGEGPEPGSNFPNWAGQLAEVVLLGNVALRVHLREILTRKRLDWDPKKMRFPNLPEADEYLHTQYRKGWSL